jgi:hypothetical protein
MQVGAPTKDFRKMSTGNMLIRSEVGEDIKKPSSGTRMHTHTHTRARRLCLAESASNERWTCNVFTRTECGVTLVRLV